MSPSSASFFFNFASSFIYEHESDLVRPPFNNVSISNGLLMKSSMLPSSFGALHQPTFGQQLQRLGPGGSGIAFYQQNSRQVVK